MHQQGPDLEQRLSKLEAQLDRFSLTLQQWQQTQKHLQPVESRLTHLIEQSNDILDRWTSSEQQYAHTVQHELSALRQLHEEPVRELRERAASLGEICVAATSSISGLERTESRFAALEGDLHFRLNELAQGLQAALVELRTVAAQRTAPSPDAAEAWPLEDVVRLHGDLRRSVQGVDTLPAADRDAARRNETRRRGCGGSCRKQPPRWRSVSNRSNTRSTLVGRKSPRCTVEASVSDRCGPSPSRSSRSR